MFLAIAISAIKVRANRLTITTRSFRRVPREIHWRIGVWVAEAEFAFHGRAGSLLFSSSHRQAGWASGKADFCAEANSW